MSLLSRLFCFTFWWLFHVEHSLSKRLECSTWNNLAHPTKYSLPVHRPGIPGEGQDALLTPRQWINVERRQTDPDPRLQMV